MDKQKLLKICTLKATPKMIKMAAVDTPVKEKYYHWVRTVYKHGLYMRCHIQGHILMVAFFLTEHLRAGGRNPAYELFIDRGRRQFITYDRVLDKWCTSKLDRLDWPAYISSSKEKWISRADNHKIKKYLNAEYDDFTALHSYQLQIRQEELKKRHKKQTDPWDKDLEQIPDLPKDWQRWVSKVGIRQHYIYYQYNKKGAESGYCTYCEKDVPVKGPRHNKEGRCPRCRHKITFKSTGKAGRVITKHFYLYLPQRCRDGFVIRMFEGYHIYPKGEYQTPECICHEIRRTIFTNSGENNRAYYWGLYRQSEHRWIRTGLYHGRWYGDAEGKVYGKTLPDLARKELSRTGLAEAVKGSQLFFPEIYLTILNERPYLEKLAKAKLPRLVKECMSSYYTFEEELRDITASSLTKILGVNTQELKRMRQNNGGTKFLAWLRYERATGKIIPAHVIAWFCRERIEADRLRFIKGKMSMVQIYNYLRRQMSKYKASSKDILIKWSDYLSLARHLKMNTDDAIIFRVNKLYQRHDELVERCHSKELALEAGEILERYPNIDAICESLNEKYGFAGEEYAIVAPSCVEDMLAEGRNLHHCLDKIDRYWERIERRETYILFLRKTAEVDKPYYTLEVEPNGTVRQKRTMYDRQEADIEDATKFLALWQKEITKRLTAEDIKLGEESRRLRVQEFAELRKNQAIINIGDLRGQLLVDVLLADLMENETIAQAA